MDAIVSSIVTPIVQSLMIPLKKHFGFYISSTKNVKAMEEQMAQLDLTEQDIQHKFDEAIERNHEVSHHVSPWLEKVEEMKEKAKSIPTGGIGCFNIVKRYKVGKQSYNIIEEIKALKEWKSKIVFTNEQKPLAVVVSTSTADGSTQNNFTSRDMIYNAALASLRSNDESRKMIALCGMGGIGKTTMMEQLKKDVEASKSFDRIVKVVLGENANPIALQRAIAIYIHQKDLVEETKSARAERLCKIFEETSKQGKKTLVIMDDLWSEVDLRDVGLSPLPNGFKMLFTSRDERICTRMGVKSDSIIKVGLLKDVEAENLFFKIVELPNSDGDDPVLRKIGEDIVKECCGLPIAIVTIAKCLSSNVEKAWEKTLWRLKKDDLKDLESISHRIFELSYENLKKDDEKGILLLSGLFPDDFNIRTEDLLRFGWGLGIFKDAKTLVAARRDVEICVSNLIRANLLNESDLMGCVKMHDLVRAFVLDKVSDVKQASIMNYLNRSEPDAKESYHRVLLKCTGMTKFPADFDYPNLAMLMLMDGYELHKFPKDMYGRMEKLEIVSYENMHIPMLPVTFEHSTKLRTLCLRSCSFISDEISLLGNLSNLEALSFVDCKLRRLPSTIGNLKKLKLLDLTGCVDLCIDDGIFQNLDHLEELYMRAIKGSPIRFTEANCDELELLSQRLFSLELEFIKYEVKPKNMSFKNLERFRISVGCQLSKLGPREEYSVRNRSEFVDAYKELLLSEEYSFRNTVEFVGDYNELLECQISDLFENTEILSLKVNDMFYLEDHTFSNLTVLCVSNCANMTYLFTVDVANGLKKLERLTISKCSVMRGLVAENNRVAVIRFQKLVFMSLNNLPKMERFWDNEIEFPKMVELNLDGLPYFTSVYPRNHNTSELQSLLNKKVVIPQLEILNISRMGNLKHIWACETIDKNNVSKLRNITVIECDNLVNLFPSNPLPLLNHLEKIIVRKCDSIEVLFNMEFESVCETMECSSSKLRSIEVDNLSKLKELWRIRGVNDKCDIRINCFNKVDRIQIWQCSMFKIFTPVTANFDLGAITNYITWRINEKNNGVVDGEILETDECIPNATYPSYFLHKCDHIQRLHLYKDERVEEVVFEMDSDQPLLLLPHLEYLYLGELNQMSHVWKCNWNKFLISQPLQSPFLNLTKIKVQLCHTIKYLFSPLMAQYLSNLKEVSLERCDGIEEVISSRDDENEEDTLSSNRASTLFPNFDSLCLQDLNCLKSIDDQSQSGHEVVVPCWSLCQYPTKIDIMTCDELPYLIPWYAVGQMKRLQELIILDCKTMKEVFESEIRSTTNNNHVDEGSANANGITLTNSMLKPSLTPTVVAPKLSNLKLVSIYECDLLSHVFTFSTLKSLYHLQRIEVAECKVIQVIVKEENSGTSTKDVVVLPHLQSLKLEGLPNLKGFFLGMNDFQFPLLDDVTFIDCPQMMVFTSAHSKAPKLKHIHTSLGKYNGTINDYHQTTFPTSSSSSHPLLWSFHNLIEINIRSRRDVGMTIIPSNALSQLENLEKIQLEFCRGIEEVFEVVASEENESKIVVKIPIPNLTQVEINSLNKFKYLWKSNQWMALEFPNLTTLSICWCDKLEHVFTCSMVGSLVQLQDLHIKHCKNIEVIVKVENEEEEKEQKCVVKVDEIKLPRLKSLKLEDLQRLKGFCLGNEDFLCPSLDTLQIKYCPEITVFTKRHVSTPELEVIDTNFGMYHVKPDLNSFIKTKQEEGYKF